MNFNSQIPSFIPHVNTYCAKVLPLVFDNSLSYYEFLCKMCHKVNECIDALNAQNLQIIEFTKMVSLELEKFEKYVDERITGFENEIKKAWEDYKTELNQAWEDYKTELNAQWETEKQKNEQFRQQLLSDFNTLKKAIEKKQADFETKIKADFETYKQNVNAEIEQFETTSNANFAQFKTTMQTQQNEFESHMVELFNAFKTTEKQARTDFESNFQQLFEQWKVDTLAALNTSITGWENESYNRLLTYINQQIGGFEASIRSEITNLSHDLSRESDARKNADTLLQNQINQLTPEGSIKADAPDSDGNSQLYTVDKTTQQRTNIFPKTNAQTGGSSVKFLTRDDGVAVNSSYFYIADSKNSFIIANNALVTKDTEIIDGILIPASLIGDTANMSPNQALLTLDINIMPCMSLLDTPMYMLNIYIDHVRFVEYNSIKYLSLPLELNLVKIDNSTGLGQNRIKCIVTIKKYS